MAAPLFVDCYNRHPCCDSWSDNGELRERRFPLSASLLKIRRGVVSHFFALVEHLAWCARARGFLISKRFLRTI